MFGAAGLACRFPDHAGEIPKRHWGIVSDEEGFAVNAFVTERSRGQARRLEQRAAGEQVRVGHIDDVGKVKEVGVVANLPIGAFRPRIEVDVVGEQLDVAGAKDTGGAEGAGEEAGVGGWSIGS